VTSRLVASFVGTVLVLAAAVGTFITVERAIVRISVAPTQVRVANVVLNGAAGRSLTTTDLEVSATNSLTVTSSTTQLPATFAGGYVSFWCSPMTSCPNGYTVPAGTLLGAVSGEQYYTLGSASFPSCQPSSPVAIRAAVSGATGNAAAGTVLYGALPSYIHVHNPGWIGGGFNARTVPVVKQSDIDAASATISAGLATDLQAKLRNEAGLLNYLPAGSPTFQTTSDAHAGDAASSVTVTVTGTLRGVAFSTASAQTLLRSLLTAKAPTGYALGPDAIAATYAWDQSTGSLTASASGYSTPVLDSRALTLALRGESLSQATARLQQDVPGSTVDIRTAPFVMPWLPMLADHISLAVVNSPA